MADHDHDEQRALYGMCLTCADRGDLKAAEGPPPTEQLPLIEDRPPVPEPPPGLGAEDAERLGAQGRRVLGLMVDGTWRTLQEITELTGDPEASVSARLRDIRHVGYGVEARPRDPARPAQQEYQVTLPRP